MKKLLTGISVLLTLLASPLFAAQPAGITKVSDNVYAVFLQYYHSLVVIGDDGVLITDPANAIRAKALKETVAKLTDLPVNKIILSHEHYDHVGGTEVFPDAEIYAHKATAPVFKLDVTGQAPASVDSYVGDQTSLMMGDTRVDLLHVGAADGVGMLAVHLPEEKLVFTADLYETNQLTDARWLADSNYLGGRKLLNTLVDFQPEYAITTHSAELDPQQLQLAAEFYNQLYAAVEPEVQKAMQQGYPAVIALMDSLPQSLKLPDYENFTNYDHLPAHVERMIFSIFHGG